MAFWPGVAPASSSSTMLPLYQAGASLEAGHPAAGGGSLDLGWSAIEKPTDATENDSDLNGK